MSHSLSSKTDVTTKDIASNIRLVTSSYIGLGNATVGIQTEDVSAFNDWLMETELSQKVIQVIINNGMNHFILQLLTNEEIMYLKLAWGR